MKIAILSDIHDNVWNLDVALRSLDDADVLLCLGDLCSPFVIPMLAQGFSGRPIHIVFGNNDGDLFRITKNAARFSNITLHAEVMRSEIGGRRVCAVHYDTLATQFSTTELDLICYGHNHRYSLEREGECLIVNPGPIMGFDPGSGRDVPASFMVYETETAELLSFAVEAAGAEDAQDATLGLVVKPLIIDQA